MAKTQKKITSLIPKSTMLATEKDIKAVIKASDTNTIHTFYNRIKWLIETIEKFSKEEIISRIKKEVGTKTVETEIGKITLVERKNYTFDEKGIEKFLLKNKINISEVFKKEYKVVTKNTKILQDLVDKSLIVETRKLNKKALMELTETYPELEQYFIEEEPTVYLKGF